MDDVQFSQVDIYYNYAFDLGQPINPIDTARRLLGTEFAQAFRNYSTRQDEVANRYRSFFVSYRRFLSARDAVNNITDGARTRGFLKLLGLSPTSYGRALLASFKRSSRVAGTSPATEEEPSEQSSARLSSMEEEVTEAVRRSVVSLVALLAIHEDVDRRVFHEDYLAETPFVRVGLQPFAAKFRGHEINFDVTLSIHRSGAAVLSAYGIFAGALGAKQITELQHASLLKIEACEIPSTIYHNYLSLMSEGSMTKGNVKTFNQQYASEKSPGYLRLDQVEEGTVLASIFDCYRFSIIQALHSGRYTSVHSMASSLRSMAWFGYPVTFTRQISPRFGSGEEFKAKHSETLAKLVIGLPTRSSLKQGRVKEICDNDLAITDDYSLYLTEGGATVLYYSDPEEAPSDVTDASWAHRKFMSTVVIDMLLFQKMILLGYTEQLGRLRLNEAGLDYLRRIRQDVLLKLEEYDALSVSNYGTVHEIIQKGQSSLRINDQYALLTRHLDNIEGLIVAAESKEQRRRERTLKTATTLVAALLSLTAADRIVAIVGNWSYVTGHAGFPWFDSLLAGMVNMAKTRPVLSTVVLYLAVFTITIIALWGESTLSFFTRNKSVVSPHKPSRSQPRTHSPFPFFVRNVDDIDDRDGDPEHP
ncbi:MAG: hypothetical protein M1305_01960 [Candidatus Marsarchaeota archaeon]|nr:hypothetical protein [Candidatus Marsarchaeota archaeon]